MASCSSSGIVASMCANSSSYDVFLSFRGEDTRHSFTDHLYDALNRAGICTFRDNEEINRGVELKSEIGKAIKESRSSIVVLSENYATSTWCLDELFLILEQRRKCNHFVLPVFYHVNPTDVRKQNKTFAIEVKASSRWTDHNVNRWKKALMEVADLAGMVLSGPETIFLKEIVDTVYNKLDCKEIHLPSNITGMATRYEEISSWLNQPNLNILAICGMGGSGKTTLAKYIYDSNWRTFETTSFVEDIGSRCKGPKDLLELQEQLLKDILGGKNRKIPCVSRGTRKIEEALQTKRTLIVLDDIAQRSQLITLLGTGKIYSRSKIIITTRENTDNWFDLMCQKYEMKLLNDDESLELLSRHAFGSKIPMAGFEELVLQAVRYCEGNPLALEVLGSSLFKKNTISNWESQLNLLEKDIDSRIQGVLIRSYMSLPYNSEKELFLHIACFFAGKDIDYVVKILEPDYSAKSGIKTLINGCLLSISPNKKLKMHRLIQEMGKNIVRQESTKVPARRSRVWLSIESYKILSKGEGSETIEGLALDMQIPSEEKFAFKSPGLNTDALKKMDNLKLLQLNFAKLDGSYENFSEDLRWLCWLGFHLRTIPSELYMGNLVAIDMSYSNLEVFEPPMVLQSLQILNLKDSHNLLEIRNISRIPHLETLIIWNCYNLVRVCETIGDLTSLVLLNMTGCKNLCKMEHLNLLVASTSMPPFSFPRSLHRLFLKDCYLECTDSFPLSFSVQPFLQYLNLGNGLFEFLPFYDHLRNLRVLDLSLCSRLKCLLYLPSTLAELYIYYCESLEKITFQSHQFTLQEFGYEGCINLTEIEGFINLVPIVKLDETDLGHLKWLKEYQNHEVCLVGDDELTVGRSWHVQMLYEFDIMSTSLPDIKDPNMTSEYVSASPSLSFEVPLCPTNKRLKGLDVTFKYTTSLLCSLSGNACAWFCKISTTNGVDFMYSPKVFGKPEVGEVGIWLGYWPIGKMLEVGDKVDVFIATLNGLEVHECGVSLVYTDDEVGEEIMENNMGFNGDLSGFQLSTGAFYLCRHDFYELMEVGRLNPHWFRILVGDTIDYTEVRGWRKTGRPKQMNPSFIELKTVKCITDGPELEDIYKIAEISKSSLGVKTVAFTSSLLEKEMKSVTRSESIDAEMEEIYKKQYVSDDEIYDLVMDKSDNNLHAIATAKMRGEYPERIGQPECQYYLRTGTCKFGAICKFHHPPDIAGVVGRVSLNALGFPLRPNEPECAYYLRTGQCKFRNTCKFHHPQPSNMMVTYSGSTVYPTVQSPTSPGQQSYPGGMTNWSLPTASFVPSPRWQGPSNYAQMILPQGVVSVPGWNAYRGSLGSIPSLESQQQAIGNNNLNYGNLHQNETATERPSGTYSSFHALQRENVFPERPGQPDCQFYMKTGDCKFGAVCRFHHPRERVIPTPDCRLSPIGLPLRPGEPLCIFYSRYGICKFGPSCKFDHPMGIFTYNFSSTSPQAHLLASSSGSGPLNITSERPIDNNSIDPEE